MSVKRGRRTHALPVAFEPHWRAASAELRANIAGFVTTLEEHERKQGIRDRARKPDDRQKFQISVECIAVNLLVISMAENGARLAVPLANSASARSQIFGKHFNAALNLMASMGLIGRKTGHRISKSNRRASSIAARKALFKHLPDTGRLSWNDFRLEPDPDAALLVLRRSKDAASNMPSDMSFNETHETYRLRAEIEELNARLASAPIAVAGADPRNAVHFTPGGETMRRLFTVHHRAVRRIFNNGDSTGQNWTEGGRLAGGFWMTLERKKRFSGLRIAGERVVSVDFEQMFLRLAYASKGLLPRDEETDLYVAGPGEREGWKRLTVALLFRKGPLERWPGADTTERELIRSCFPEGTTLGHVVKAINAKHAAIADCFERGLGFRLMRQESDILLAALERLGREGIAALPLHDAVLVPQSQALRTKAVMEQEALRLTGSRLPCKVETGAGRGG